MDSWKENCEPLMLWHNITLNSEKKNARRTRMSRLNKTFRMTVVESSIILYNNCITAVVCSPLGSLYLNIIFNLLLVASHIHEKTTITEFCLVSRIKHHEMNYVVYSFILKYVRAFGDTLLKPCKHLPSFLCTVINI